MIELRSAIKLGDAFTVPLRVALHRSRGPAGEWVTHLQNTQDGSFFTGHYFRHDEKQGGELGAYRAALKDYLKRTGELGVDPLPSEAVSAIPAGIARPAVRQGARRAN